MTDLEVRAFRRTTILVFLAYALPLLAAPATVVIFGVRDTDGGATPIGALAGLAGFGFAWATWRALGTRFGGRRHERGKPASDRRVAAILREFPEFSRLRMEGAGEPSYVGVNGRALLIGADYLAQTGGGADRMSDDLYQKLAHEARHLKVGAFGLVFAFRWLKQIYLVIGLATYAGFLANWAALLDGPGRLALMIYGAALPYIMAALFVVLDEMMDAYEWRLELDADRAAAARCRSAGRPFSNTLPKSRLRLAKRLSDRYPPTPLRLIALSGGIPTKLQIWAPLLAGLLVAIVPIALDMVFAFVTPAHPDTYNAALGFLLIVSLTLAGIILLASSIAGGGRSATVMTTEATVPNLPQAIALFAVRLCTVGWTFMSLAAFSLLTVCAVPVLASLRRGVPTPLVILILLGILAVGRWYWRSSTDWPSSRALARGGACEFVRLSCQFWFITALAVFPFFNDLGGLGGAIMRNNHLVTPELSRLFITEPARMLALAGVAAGLALAIVALALSGRTIAQRRMTRGDYSSLAVALAWRRK